jgi:hypothetical protein
MSDSDDYKNFLKRHIGVVGQCQEGAGHVELVRTPFGWHYGYYVLEAVKDDYVVLRWNNIIKQEVPISRFSLSATGASDPPTDWLNLVSYHLGTKSRTKNLNWSTKEKDLRSAKVIYQAINPALSEEQVDAALEDLSKKVAADEMQNRGGGACLLLVCALLACGACIVTGLAHLL